MAFETCTLDDPEGRTKYGYNKLLNNSNAAPTRAPAGVKRWVRSELVLRQDYPEMFVRSVQQVEDDDAFVVLSIGLRLTSEAAHENEPRPPA